MKWYFAINEAGALGEAGMHARLAVASARRNTTLEPVLLYHGARNGFIDWMAARGVQVVAAAPRFLGVIRELGQETHVGHWLRLGACLIETRDPFVLYTDCDVIFTEALDLSAARPAVFAAAPEFQRDNWNYVNTGVMLCNVASLRESYAALERYVIDTMRQVRSVWFNDEYAYNAFYRGRWERLDPRLNWKPYWGDAAGAKILHFHGPKPPALEMMLDGRWDWQDATGRQLGSLACAFQARYPEAIEVLLAATEGDCGPERDRFARLRARLLRERISPPDGVIDLGFTNTMLFEPA